LALIGALLLVLAESRVEGKSLFAGVPSLGMLSFIELGYLDMYSWLLVSVCIYYIKICGLLLSSWKHINTRLYKVMFAEYIKETTDNL
jgi:uncharacterized membrane protein